jgi:hypothetical protein
MEKIEKKENCEGCYFLKDIHMGNNVYQYLCYALPKAVNRKPDDIACVYRKEKE